VVRPSPGSCMVVARASASLLPLWLVWASLTSLRPAPVTAAAGCPDTTCMVAIYQAYATADPVVQLRGRWFPPAEPVATGRVRYFVRVASRADDGAAQLVDFGIYDGGATLGSRLFASCSGCFNDTTHPPPAPGWQALTSHGTPAFPIEFILNFDVANNTVAWYAYDSVVRLEKGIVFDGGSVVSIGAIVEGRDTMLSPMWHNQLFVIQESGRHTVFAPDDWRTRHWTPYGVFALRYFTDGSVFLSNGSEY
jgi:hypothetical protein